MAVNPKNGRVYVTNTEAHNEIRFEGHTAGFSSVRGHITDSRITVIDPAAGTVTPRDLNPHVDFTQEGNPAEKALSIAFPEGVQVSSRRQRRSTPSRRARRSSPSTTRRTSRPAT